MSFAHFPSRLPHRGLFWAAVLAVGLVAAPIASGQTSALDRVMRQKLSHSQVLLAAVVTSNWADLERHSQALIDLTADPAWTVLKTPEYATQSAAFVRAVQDLVDAAKRHDLNQAPTAYTALTLRCVQCHRYVARARIAGLLPAHDAGLKRAMGTGK